MRPFGCPVTIPNTLDHLGKFDRKTDEGFFVGYSVNSKAFRVFNSRIRIVEETPKETTYVFLRYAQSGYRRYDVKSKRLDVSLNVFFNRASCIKQLCSASFADCQPVQLTSEDSSYPTQHEREDADKEEEQELHWQDSLQVEGRIGPNVAGSTKESIDAGQAGKKTVHSHEYILLPLWTPDSPISSSLKSSDDKVADDVEKKSTKDLAKEDDYDDQDLRDEFERLIHQEKDENVNSTNNINNVSSTVNTASINDNVVDENIVYGCEDDLNMRNLEEIVYSDDDEDVGAEADMTNLDTHILVSPILTTRIHKDYPVEQIIGDIHSAPQTRRMIKHVTNHVEPKKVIQALTDLSWIEAMQDELLQNKKDERGITVKNKAMLVAQGYTQEEGLDYDEVFAPVARIETIRLFLAYASFKYFVVYQMDVKSAFLYGKIEEEVYVYQPRGFEDPEFPNRVYKVEKALYGLHQALRVWYETLSTYLLDNGFQRGQIDKTFSLKGSKKFQMSSMGELTFFLGLQVTQKDYGIFVSQDKSMIGSLMYLTSSRPDIMFAVCACARFQVTPKVSHLHVVKRIFRYLKGQPKLGLWYPKDSPFDLEAYTNSDYAGASLDRKSTTGDLLTKAFDVSQFLTASIGMLNL
ncbi:putative ribonuclease H-like domain-containing protein [Tanacetum coccineum]|uniref:Ribonuclease H-like domain-containing protein n=1 Tax=Tanacetum coccineum TaxID=301880 RepID=A0ABQ5FMD8_9ASTR